MSNLIFETSRQGRRCVMLPISLMHGDDLYERIPRQSELELPEVAEIDIVVIISVYLAKPMGWTMASIRWVRVR
jgi:hypothetical protein